MKADTTLGDALRDFADLCDLHPEWDVFAALVTKDGWRLNYSGTKDETPPEAAARAILTAVEIASGQFDDSDLNPAPFEAA